MEERIIKLLLHYYNVHNDGIHVLTVRYVVSLNVNQAVDVRRVHEVRQVAVFDSISRHTTSKSKLVGVI